MGVATKQLSQVEGMAAQLQQAMKASQKKVSDNDFWVGEQAAKMLKFASWGAAALLGATALATVAAAPVLALAGAAVGAGLATAGTLLERTAAERAEMRSQAQEFMKDCKSVMRELHTAYQQIKHEAKIENQGGYTPSADLINYQAQRQQQVLEQAAQQDAGVSYGQSQGASARQSGPRFG